MNKSKFFCNVYIAQIEGVILGLDFMLFHKANVDLANHKIRINDDSYGAKYRSDHGEAFQVSRVVVSKRTVVPPQPTVHEPCKLEHAINSLFAFQPKRSSTRALLPNAVYMSCHGVCSLPVINDTDCYLTLKERLNGR